ncbi:Hypothetical predicted protein [Lecanosticta acicola]|uniref:Uncharacterized protein n=1 Tax=Lecanosticta acicola TaxID=111012 RepID=A0AAI8YUN7_9PEZI|nr:Hypothetical predicted protein [Lecanosticta acicola]
MSIASRLFLSDSAVSLTCTGYAKMHYLHPRSRSTSTLFTTTLAISFLVVAAPHLLPCPVDRRQFADSFETPDGKRYRRKRKEVTDGGDEHEGVGDAASDLAKHDRSKRECPVPKPGGLVGQLMGFKNEERSKSAEVVVRPLDTRKSQQSQNQNDTP